MRPLLCSFLSAIASATEITRIPSCQLARRRVGGPHDQCRRRTVHKTPVAISATAPATNGQTGMPPRVLPPVAAGPGVAVPATVSRNDQDPAPTWPSADVTR